MSIKNRILREHEDAQRRAIQLWAEVAAANKYHEVEIIVPPEFNRQQALDALEIAVILKYSPPPLLQLGQGRASADTPWFEVGLLVAAVGGTVAGLLALYGLAVWLL